ncbi:MAG: hypothetical protein EOM14_10155 [Clostridia bacterium]|nr:hypothetical protein [Clostridia bacterium]
MSYNAKVYMAQGGDELVVAAGGKITEAGTQALTIAALKVNYTTGDLDTEAEIITAINATNTAINAVVAALKGVGIIASS